MIPLIAWISNYLTTPEGDKRYTSLMAFGAPVSTIAALKAIVADTGAGVGDVYKEQQTRFVENIRGISTPTIPTVTPQGTPGSTTYGYQITAVNANGETPLSPERETTTGHATLDETNFNRITWSTVSGATSYKIYRTTAGGTPNTVGLIGSVADPTATFDDTGIATSGNIPTTKGSYYTFDSSSTATTDGILVVRPDDIANDTIPGRWHQTPFNVLGAVLGSGNGVATKLAYWTDTQTLDDTAGIVYTASTGAIAATLQADISSGNAYSFSGAGAGELTASSGTQKFLNLIPIINQSGTGGYTGIFLDATETATGSGTKSLCSLGVGGSPLFTISNSGNATIGGATTTTSAVKITSTGVVDSASYISVGGLDLEQLLSAGTNNNERLYALRITPTYFDNSRTGISHYGVVFADVGAGDTLSGFGTLTPSSTLDVTRAGIAASQSNAYGISLVNTTAAVNGTQQYSPPLRWRGFVWETTGGTSQSVDFRSYIIPVQGTTGSGYLALESSINGAAFANPFKFYSGGNLELPGHLLWTSDNSKDIGASGATRPRTGYFGTSVVVGSTGTLTTNTLDFSAGGTLTTVGANLSLNPGNSIVSIGGTTASFPAIKRNTTALNFRLADDSADAAFTSGAATLSGLLSFTGTTHAGLRVLSLTTTQRDALTPANGDLIYNTTNARFEKREGGAWKSLTGGLDGVANGTTNSVPFFDTATTLSANSLFVWNNTTYRMGIGTSSPSGMLHIDTNIPATYSHGFEDQTFGDFTTTVPNGTPTITNSQPHTGIYSVRMRGDGNVPELIITKTWLTGGGLFNFWVYFGSGSNSNHRLRVRVDNNIVVDYIADDANNPIGSWTQKSISISAGAHTVKFQAVKTLGSSTYDYYLDDFELTNTQGDGSTSTGAIILGRSIFGAVTSPSSVLDVTKNSIGVTQANANGFSLVNTTAAADGAQQYSPPIRWRGFGWKTDATAASQSVDFRSYLVPVQGAANPTGYLLFESSVNGGAYSENMRLTSAGVLTTATLNLSGTSNQIVLQSAGVTGTITATPTSSGKIWTFPDATGTVSLQGQAQTFPTLNLTGDSNQIVFDSDGAATGTLTWSPTSSNKTVTIPDLTGTVALTTNAQTFSSKTLDNTNTANLKDTLFTLEDDGDTNKKAQFQCSSITSGQTRTYTLPDVSDTLVTIGAIQTLQNKSLDNTTTFETKDTLFTLQDDGDSSKKLQFQLSGITTSTTRTLTIPNASGQIALSSAVETFTSLNLTANNNQIVFDSDGAATGTLTWSPTSSNKTITIPDITDTLVTLTAAQILTNKQLTAPKFADTGFISDTNTNELIIFSVAASAVNEITVGNAATGNNPFIQVTGGDSDPSLLIIPKGNGGIVINGQANRTLQTARNTTADTAGNSFTLKVGGATSGATDKAGGDLKIQSGIGTGNSTPSRVIVECPAQGTASGTSDQTLQPRVVINEVQALTQGVATTVLVVTAASNSGNGGIVGYTVESDDGTDFIVASGFVAYSLVNKAGTYTGATSVLGTEAIAKSDGTDTMVNVWGFEASSGNLQITSTITGQTPTTLRITFSVLNNGQQAVA